MKSFTLIKYGKSPNETNYKSHILTKEECRKAGRQNIEVVKQMKLVKAAGHEILKFLIRSV